MFDKTGRGHGAPGADAEQDPQCLFPVIPEERSLTTLLPTDKSKQEQPDTLAACLIV